ncbi:putative phosphatase regulatory subunit-domain-containing protein [Russula vinacea]|nr:putative phosphatase regulatory subunit-domain-containing protein [Russula vinacea]
MPYVASRSPATFSNERGPGPFAPLNTLPRLSTPKKSLFHIPNDDDNDQQEEHSPPHSHHFLPNPPPSNSRVDPPSVPFPTASPDSVNPAKSSSPPIQRTTSSTSIILSNGRPLKPSLKSASSSSITDDMAPSAARHTRTQSMPSTPAFGPKNVHFKEKEDGLESVRLFRRTGKPVSVSKPTSDTETETEPEPSGFPFPQRYGSSGSALTQIATCSAIPAPDPSPYANVHLESVALPPARPPVLRGTILVRNIVFEKHVGVRFTLDDWTTVSETVGDLIGPTATGWDRFNFAIKLEDYEAYLWQRTLFFVTRFSAPGAGEFWDNNSGENYRVTFRSQVGPVQSERKRGISAPSTTPFLMSACPASPLASRVSTHDEPRPTFASPQRPPTIPRSASSPIPAASTAGLRLNLRHYAAPTPPPRSPMAVNVPRPPPPSGAPRVIIGGQSTIPSHPETPISAEKPVLDKDEVDEGFGTGSEDGEVAETRPASRPQLSLKITPPTPVTIQVSPVSPTPSPPPRQRGPFSPMHGPFSPRSGGHPDDSTYATLIREWCFAQGPDTFGAGTIGAQSAVPWVGGLS